MEAGADLHGADFLGKMINLQEDAFPGAIKRIFDMFAVK
jgi:hypothetical protein